ncbi:post-GPI attachment to proteins factor 6 isoform X2 [Lingula anatina]|uniref:Post-GPI attachment to proteins factor 6 isoform X2 n=1 Tax=Lingula anatina TaxID=7574 RepID=A0A1S3JQ76_LINAN|nr:post-GPI attachment to proteins factor 6 isoform X2 [Lingula anatina]|eukprot:XP_013412109.1 post-GPI attachment to proteins factor 6 isoform X2 [Lingula anatina]
MDADVVPIIFIWVLQNVARTSGYTFVDTTWTTGLEVSEYESYKNMRLFKFEVPDDTVRAVFSMKAIVKGNDRCPNRKISVNIQEGGYPLHNTSSDIFPDKFYLNRSMSISLPGISTDAHSTSTELYLSVPKPGSYFAGAFISEDKDGKSDGITQKEFKEVCHYFITITMLSYTKQGTQQMATSQNNAVQLGPHGGGMYRMFMPNDVWRYVISINKCVVHTNLSQCPVVLYTRSASFPVLRGRDKDTHLMNCTDAGIPCRSTVHSPLAGTWLYLYINNTYNATVDLILSVLPDECLSINSAPQRRSQLQSPISSDSQVTVTVFPMNEDSQTNRTAANTTETQVLYNVTNQEGKCAIGTLGRFQGPGDFRAQFWPHVEDVALASTVVIPVGSKVVWSYEILPQSDAGGTLHISVHINSSSMPIKPYNTSVKVCIMRGRLPLDDTGVTCPDTNMLSPNTSDGDSSESEDLYIPYPESGRWYMGLQALCYEFDALSNQTKPVLCTNYTLLDLHVSLSPCVDGECGKYGECRAYSSGMNIYSTCVCFTGYHGYGCTDTSQALPESVQLLQTMLLTLSNLFFIPGIVLAIYRRFYVEAFVYAFNMFFSTFYHACDRNRLYTWCLMKYDTLSFCDFYGSIMSFWVTIIIMARLPDEAKWFLHMLGALGISIGVEYDRYSLPAFIVPFAIAAVVTFGSWMYQCRKRRSCYPSKKRWLCYLLPGILLAGIGLCVFAFAETDENYAYTHSVWHFTIASSVFFLLPPRRRKSDQCQPGAKDRVVTALLDHEGNTVQAII